MTHTKRNHYIPIAYSKNFCTSGTKPPTGFLYQKKSPEKIKIVQPKDFGVINNDLVFTKNDGSKDHKKFETLYGTIEDQWPALVHKFENSMQLDDENLQYFYLFICIMAFRVPSFRRRREASIANNSKTMIKVGAPIWLQDRDEKFRENCDKVIKNDLFNVVVSPEESLKNLDIFVESFIENIKDLCWIILKNQCTQKFIINDNPLIWHNFKRTENTNRFVPYLGGLQDKYVEIIFPITKDLVVIGSRLYPSIKQIDYQEISVDSFVKKINRYLVISAENFIFSSQNNLEKLVQNHSRLVPIIRHVEVPDGNGIHNFMFADLGSHHDLPSWTEEDEKKFTDCIAPNSH